MKTFWYSPSFSVFPWPSLIHIYFPFGRRKSKHVQSLFLCGLKPKETQSHETSAAWSFGVQCRRRSWVYSSASPGLRLSHPQCVGISALQRRRAQQFLQVWSLYPWGSPRLLQGNPWGQNYFHNNSYHKKQSFPEASGCVVRRQTECRNRVQNPSVFH